MLFATIAGDACITCVFLLGFIVWSAGHILNGIDKENQIGNSVRESLIRRINKFWKD